MKFTRKKLKINPILLPLVASIPALFFGWRLSAQMEELDTYSEKIHMLHKKSLTISQKPTLTKSDPLYLEKHLESLTFASGDKLVFAEENLKRVGNKQEVIERQKKPIEIDEIVLKRILSIVEDVSIDSEIRPSHRPQLLFQHFELTKKKSTPEENTFVLNMQLIKREIL